jgi:hypothetical protein
MGGVRGIGVDMAYQKVQFIAYKINTFPTDGSDYKNRAYLGNANAEKDISKRCAIMKTAIRETLTDSKIDGDSKTLKIFMAPEFYFRGTEGAYPLEKVSSILAEMRNYTKNEKFKHWMFVFGTALGYLDASDKKEIFNVALIQKGGVNTAEKDQSAGHNAVLVYKEFISHIDFLRDKNKDWTNKDERIVRVASGESLVIPTLGSRDLGTMGANDASEYNASGLGGGSIFEMNGINFGLEVCLDHLLGRLRGAIANKDTSWIGKIQIQLVTSAGAYIEGNHIAVCHRGLVFNVDGNGASRAVIADYNTAQLMDIVALSEGSLQAGPMSQQSSISSHLRYFNTNGSYVIYNPTKIPSV